MSNKHKGKGKSKGKGFNNTRETTKQNINTIECSDVDGEANWQALRPMCSIGLFHKDFEYTHIKLPFIVDTLRSEDTEFSIFHPCFNKK